MSKVITMIPARLASSRLPNKILLDINGKPLENKQLNPEVIIYNNPGDVERGHDAQLEGAVRHLLEQLDK